MRPQALEILAEYLDARWEADPAGEENQASDAGTVGIAGPAGRFDQAVRCAALLDAAFSPEGLADGRFSLLAPDGADFRPFSATTLGRFHIRRLLGSGGMAQVFLAFDPQIRREVALKIPHLGAAISPGTRERFLREARAAGAVQHPHIVPVYEAGEVGGVCYIASQYCSGPTLGQWLKKQEAPVECRVAADILARLADAMRHAHERGILHRDLKPGNVLLAPRGPDRLEAPGSGELPNDACHDTFPYSPQLTDFGLASFDAGDASLTATHALLGTAAYMAPEQARGDVVAISVRSDVYSLGIIGCELLTGVSPFRRDSVAATLAAVQQGASVSVGRLRPDVPPDLCAICEKATAHLAAERYGSAAELRDDLLRFLNGEPVRARRAGVGRQILAWMRRRPTVAGAVAVSCAAMVLAVLGVLWHNHRLARELVTSEELRRRSSRAEAEAVRGGQRLAEEVYAADIAAAHQVLVAGDARRAYNLLSRYNLPGSAGSGVWERPETRDVRGWEWTYLWRHVAGSSRNHVVQRSPCYCVRLFPDERRLAVAGGEGQVHLLRFDTLEEELAIPTGQVEVNDLQIAPDGLTLVTAGDDGTVRWWDAATGRSLRRLHVLKKAVYGVKLLDGGQIAVCGKSPIISIWDVETGQVVRELAGHQDDVETMALSPDGQSLVSGGYDGSVVIWELAAGTVRQRLPSMTGRVSALAFSPRGDAVALADIEGNLRVWALDADQPCWDQRERDSVRALVWSADGEWLTIGTRGGTVRHLRALRRPDASPGPVDWRAAWLAHQESVGDLALTSDGEHLASVGYDGQVKVWEPRYRATPFEEYQLIATRVSRLMPGPTPERLLADTPGGLAWFRPDARSFEHLGASAPNAFGPYAVSPDGRVVVACCRDGKLARAALNGPLQWRDWGPGYEGQVENLEFTANGDYLVVHCPIQNLVAILDAETGAPFRELHAPGSESFAISPDSASLAVAQKNSISLWSVSTGLPTGRLEGHSQTVYGLAFSPAGEWLASVAGDRRLKIWDWRSGRERHTCEGTDGHFETVRFASDGKTLLAMGPRTPLTLWHVPTGRQLFTFDSASPMDEIFLNSAAGWIVGWRRNQTLWGCSPTGLGNYTRHGLK